MPALPPEVAAVRLAVRRALETEPPAGRDLVLVACSGGPDSLALAAATSFVAPRLGLRAGLITVDHGLQEGSAVRAELVARWGSDRCLAPVRSVRVQVKGRPGGPEAAARDARYQALVTEARRVGAGAVLLGHTLDDQAETVLLALARGSGPRGIAGMPARRLIDGVAFLRPLLGLSRDLVRSAGQRLGLEPWEDPQNFDPSFARARVRAALPVLTGALGDRVVANLARTAELVAADLEVLDRLTAEAMEKAAAGGAGLGVQVLAELPAGLRRRVLHRWARTIGVPGTALSHRHVGALDALVVRWHGQGSVGLPGAIAVSRRSGRLVPATSNVGMHGPGADGRHGVRQA